MTASIPPDPERLNKKRAFAAEAALLSFARNFGETDAAGQLGEFAEQNLADLLANLAHYCDRKDLRMAKCLSIAGKHYKEETGNKGNQF